MPYDRDSFLTGLAVGRTLWRPHRDYASVIPPDRYILSYQDLTDMWNHSKSESEFFALRKQYYAAGGARVDEKDGVLTLYGAPMGNRAYQFFEPIPARAMRVYITLEGIAATGSYKQFAACINDAQGLTGYYLNSFAGNNLKTIFFVTYNHTVEWLNEQDATFEYPFTTTDECIKQTVVIDMTDVSVDSYIGFQNCDSYTYIYEIRWE